MGKTTQIEAAALAGAPSDQLKAVVLDAVYHLEGLKVLSGFHFLAAQHLKTNVGIFVVAGLGLKEGAKTQKTIAT